jgi:hypothetical protein
VVNHLKRTFLIAGAAASDLGIAMADRNTRSAAVLERVGMRRSMRRRPSTAARLTPDSRVVLKPTL